MIFLMYNDLIPILATSALFWMLPVFHRLLIPQMYASVITFVYSGNPHRTRKSTVVRLLYVIFGTMFLYKIMLYTQTQILIGIFVACFLNVWPAIIQYKLFYFYRSKEKIICLLGYMSFILFSIVVSVTTILFLCPIIFDNKEFIITNDGVGMIISLASYIAPIQLETLLSKSSVFIQQDIDTFRAEIQIIRNQMCFECNIIKNYNYEIEEICRKNSINTKLLTSIILLEHINRGAWYYRYAEWFCCKYLPRYAIKKDLSVGVTQIRISTAKKVLKKAPQKFVKNLVNDSFNIEVCGLLLASIISDYEAKSQKDWSANSDDIFEYISMQYLCGRQSNCNPTVMVYSSILRARCNNEVSYC